MHELPVLGCRQRSLRVSILVRELEVEYAERLAWKAKREMWYICWGKEDILVSGDAMYVYSL